jgi:capsular polysaccharide biosynthesis protein
VIPRLLEAFFRHFVILLLPPLLIPSIVTPIAYYATPTYYESFANVWVGNSGQRSGEDFNPYISPAQNQVNRLNEVLRTRSFQLEVAQRTSLAPLVATRNGQLQIASFISSNFRIVPNGNRLLVLGFRAPTPQLAAETLTAIMDTFRDRLARDRAEQAQTTVTFYENQVSEAESQLAKSTEALRRYVASNPRAAASDPTRAGSVVGGSQAAALAAMTDPQLADLMRIHEINQANVDRGRRAAEQARLDSAASVQGQEASFQVIDPAGVPTEITRERRRALVYVIGAVLAGLGLSATILVLLVATDRSIHSVYDLKALHVDAPVLGAIPRLRVASPSRARRWTLWRRRARSPRWAGASVVRRAVGYVAGTSLELPARA